MTKNQNVTVRYQSVMQGLRKIRKRSREWEEKIDLYENTNRRLERGQENMADFLFLS